MSNPRPEDIPYLEQRSRVGDVMIIQNGVRDREAEAEYNEETQRVKSTLSSQVDDGFGSRVSHVLSEVYELLLEKNRKYGDSALNPIRGFSNANPTEQLRVRIDDKLKRQANGDTTEDLVLDLLGYLVLLRIAEGE